MDEMQDRIGNGSPDSLGNGSSVLAAVSFHVAAFVVGALVMAFEMIASRFLVTVAGSSILTWASLISVVMVAMTAGYWLGGLLADKYPHARAAGLLLVVSAICTVLSVVFCVPQLLWVVGLCGSERSSALAGSFLLTFVPMLFLSTYSPYAIRLSLSHVRRSGGVAGRIYGISTLGSVVGTLGTSFYLIPRYGSTMIGHGIAATALATGIALVIVDLATRRTPRRLAWGLGCAALLSASVLGFAALASRTHARTVSKVGHCDDTVSAETFLSLDDGTIETCESLYNDIHVVKDGSYVSMRVSTNKKFFNESKANVSDPTELPLFYTQLMPIGFAYPPTVRQWLMIGLGGGSMATYAHRYMPGVTNMSVDLDAEVLRVAQRYFAYRTADCCRVACQDGRIQLRDNPAKYDVIMLDAFRGGYIPFHLLTLEFFQLVAERLEPGGCVVANLHSGSALIDATMVTMSNVFDHMDTYHGEEAGNVVVVAYNGQKLSKEVVFGRAAKLQEQCAFRYDLRTVLNYYCTFPYDGETEVLRDDFAPAEFLDAVKRHNTEADYTGKPGAEGSGE